MARNSGRPAFWAFWYKISGRGRDVTQKLAQVHGEWAKFFWPKGQRTFCLQNRTCANWKRQFGFQQEFWGHHPLSTKKRVFPWSSSSKLKKLPWQWFPLVNLKWGESPESSFLDGGPILVGPMFPSYGLQDGSTIMSLWVWVKISLNCPLLMYITCHLSFPIYASIFVEIPLRSLRSPKVPSCAGDIPIFLAQNLRVCHWNPPALAGTISHHLGHGPRHQGAVASLRLLNRRAGEVDSHHQLDAALTMLPGVPLAPFGRMGKGETLLFVASAVAKNETWLAEGSCKWCFYWEKIYNAGSRVGFPMPAQIWNVQTSNNVQSSNTLTNGSALSRKLMFSRVPMSVNHWKGHKRSRCKGKFSDLSVCKNCLIYSWMFIPVI